jgi:hypothetical protein
MLAPLSGDIARDAHKETCVLFGSNFPLPDKNQAPQRPSILDRGRRSLDKVVGRFSPDSRADQQKGYGCKKCLAGCAGECGAVLCSSLLLLVLLPAHAVGLRFNSHAFFAMALKAVLNLAS